MDGTAALSIILAILLPPLAVFLRFGLGRLFWLDVLLTLVAWLPGAVCALILVLRASARRDPAI
jgi:uncharacterized membrane protein YqaE (UPF0057 family)